MITLVISDNEGTTTRVPLAIDQLSIGRKEGNTIRLTERNISREHCSIKRLNGSDYVIRDHNSYNGVIVNGRKIEGEQPVKPGDDIRIGDYTVALESDVKVSVPPPPPPPPPSAIAQAQDETKKTARAPARLVVMTQPLAGADFSLPESGKVRVGRAAEVEVSIDHRSVSREHAVIEVDAARVRIVDQQSANGVLLNGEKVSEATLAAGDVIELGDVLLRFVAAGDKYVFDPIEARALVASRRPRARRHLVAAGAIIAAAVVGAIFIVRSPTQPVPGESPKISPTKPATELAATAGPAAPAAAVPAESDRVPELVAACRDALEGGRFAEGVAHANAALKLRPEDTDALACQGQARAGHEQEQSYVRAAAALESGDVEGAWNELLGLDAGSSVARRPEVKDAIEDVAEKVLERAVQLARRDLVQAAALARSVADRQGLPESLQTRARSLFDKTETSARSQHAPRAEPAPRAAQKPRPASQGGASPIDTASACLARGDNACVIRALAGRAQTAQELGLLIETYRALGESAQAYRSMATYVQRFPTARRAEAYRQMLARQGQ